MSTTHIDLLFLFCISQVRRVPGSGEEFLLRLKGLPETELPAQPGYPTRRGYSPAEPHPYTIISLDDQRRLARVVFFDPTNPTNQLLKVDFGGWKEVNPDTWISCTQKTTITARDGTQSFETLRVGKIAINEPFFPDKFSIAKQAKGIQFITRDAMKGKLQEQ